jgi:hypothetical protein
MNISPNDIVYISRIAVVTIGNRFEKTNKPVRLVIDSVWDDCGYTAFSVKNSQSTYIIIGSKIYRKGNRTMAYEFVNPVIN